MEASKLRVWQKSLDSNNRDKMRVHFEAKYCNRPMLLNYSPRKLGWPDAVFSRPIKSKCNKLFEPSELWYEPAKDVSSAVKMTKKRLFKSSSRDWFKHDHSDPDLNENIRSEETIEDIENSEDEKICAGERKELNDQEKLYYSKRSHAEELANKQRQESDNWFDYESNLKWPYHFPPNKVSSPEVEFVKRKYSGIEMKMVLSPKTN